jgi:hypothetical protein
MNIWFPESDIRIDAEGVWYYRGAEMTRREIIVLFYDHLRRDESGRYYIEIGAQRYPVDVEDMAYVIREVRWADNGNEAKGRAHLLLSDGSVEELDPDTLKIGADDIPYCSVKGGRFDARFSRSSYYQLAESIQHDPRHDTFSISGRPIRKIEQNKNP